MKFIFSIALIIYGCSINNNRSDNCVIKDDEFLNKIFFNTDKFDDVVKQFIEKGYTPVNTNEKMSENHLSNIIQLRKNNNLVSYIGDDISVFYAEISDPEISFYRNIKIGSTIHDFTQKSRHPVAKNCNSIKLTDKNGVGTITFYFENDALSKVIVDFEVP